jgi:hypothetical protein
MDSDASKRLKLGSHRQIICQSGLLLALGGRVVLYPMVGSWSRLPGFQLGSGHTVHTGTRAANPRDPLHAYPMNDELDE